MMSSNGSIFRVTGLSCGEYISRRWISRTRASDAELWCFLWSAPELTVEQTMGTLVFETPSRSLWRHCNAFSVIISLYIPVSQALYLYVCQANVVSLYINTYAWYKHFTCLQIYHRLLYVLILQAEDLQISLHFFHNQLCSHCLPELQEMCYCHILSFYYIRFRLGLD